MKIKCYVGLGKGVWAVPQRLFVSYLRHNYKGAFFVWVKVLSNQNWTKQQYLRATFFWSESSNDVNSRALRDKHVGPFLKLPVTRTLSIFLQLVI